MYFRVSNKKCFLADNAPPHPSLEGSVPLRFYKNFALNIMIQLCSFKVLASGLECLNIVWLLILFGLGLRFVVVTFGILQVDTVAIVPVCICLHQTAYLGK
jgi:hypothetical protein